MPALITYVHANNMTTRQASNLLHITIILILSVTKAQGMLILHRLLMPPRLYSYACAVTLLRKKSCFIFQFSLFRFVLVGLCEILFLHVLEGFFKGAQHLFWRVFCFVLAFFFFLEKGEWGILEGLSFIVVFFVFPFIIECGVFFFGFLGVFFYGNFFSKSFF